MKSVPQAPGSVHKKVKGRLVFDRKFDQNTPLIRSTVKREICKLISRGLTMDKICEVEGIPPKHIIYDLIWRDAEFEKMYRAARLSAAEVWANEIRENAAKAANLDSVAEKKSMAHVQAIRLQVDTDKWLLSKMLRAQYGDDLPAEDGKSANTMLEIIKAVAQLARTPAAEPRPVRGRVVVPELEN